MITQLVAPLAIDAGDFVGEGPAWSVAHQRFTWTDNARGIIHAARPDGAGDWREVHCWELGRPVGAAMPRAGGGFVVAAGIELLLVDEGGTIAPFARLDVDPERISINDAKVDPQGRIWAGTTSRTLQEGEAGLFRVEANGTAALMLDGVSLSNGLDWSPDGSVFYYTDTFARTVYAFDFDSDKGTISNQRPFMTVPFGEGMPDGMIVDDEGCVWMAIVGSGGVVRYSPDGILLARVAISTPAASSCAFGGADGGDLLITSLGRRMPDAVLKFGVSAEAIEGAGTAPGRGGVFFCRPGVTGPPATLFPG